MKSQVITKVITDLPLVTIDICRTFYGNLSYICGLKTKNVILMLVLEPSLAASMAENNLWVYGRMWPDYFLAGLLFILFFSQLK